MQTRVRTTRQTSFMHSFLYRLHFSSFHSPTYKPLPHTNRLNKTMTFIHTSVRTKPDERRSRLPLLKYITNSYDRAAWKSRHLLKLPRRSCDCVIFPPDKNQRRWQVAAATLLPWQRALELAARLSGGTQKGVRSCREREGERVSSQAT